MSRSSLVLLAVMTLVLIMLALSGAFQTPVSVAILGVYLCLLVGLLGQKAVQDVRRQISARAPRRRPIVTQAAQNALARAPSSSILLETFQLQDVGLVIDERVRGGVALRRARFISLDDESLRPYVVIHYPRQDSPRPTIIRFEIRDLRGKAQFVYEMEHILRGGENLIMANYRLPLKDNNKLSAPGHWELHISMDGYLLGVHNFDMLPTMSERIRRASPDGELAPKSRLALEQEEPLPVSIEELLGKSASR